MTRDFESTWAAKYIGLPFRIGARGPDAYDCWGLVRLIYAQERGIELSLIEGVSALNLEAYEIAAALEIKNHWQQVTVPEEFDVVCLGTAGERFFHLGLWVTLSGTGRILHTREKANAVIDTMRQISFKLMTIKKFYRYKGGKHVLAH